MADTLATILNPVASATGTAPSKTAGVTTKPTDRRHHDREQFQHVPHAAHHAAEEPEPARTARHQPVHPAARPVHPGRAADEDEHAAHLADQHRADGAVDRRDGLSRLDRDGRRRHREARERHGDLDASRPTSRRPPRSTSRIRPARWSIRAAITVNAGQQNFQWDGRGNNGTKYPDGNYTLAISAKDASGQSVAISTEVSGTVDSVDLTQEPADAHDRRPELHGRQDQAGRAAGRCDRRVRARPDDTR